MYIYIYIYTHTQQVIKKCLLKSTVTAMKKTCNLEVISDHLQTYTETRNTVYVLNENKIREKY